jgi:hypothetical protein
MKVSNDAGKRIQNRADAALRSGVASRAGRATTSNDEQVRICAEAVSSDAARSFGGCVVSFAPRREYCSLGAMWRYGRTWSNAHRLPLVIDAVRLQHSGERNAATQLLARETTKLVPEMRNDIPLGVGDGIIRRGRV